MTKKSRETTKTNKVMEEISEDLRNMHVDGFSHIFSKNSDKLVVKLVWLVLVISSAAACTFLVIKSVNEYLHYEVTTTSRVLTEHQSNIPAITICNFNPFTTDYAASLFAQANLTNSFLNMWQLDTYWKNTTGSYLSLDQKTQMSSLSDILIYCKIGFFACSPKNFQFIYHLSYYNCYRFNSGVDANQQATTLLSTVTSGFVSALTIDLYAGLSDSQYNSPSSQFKGNS